MQKRKERLLLGAAQPLQPLLLTIPEVAALLGVHRSKVYTLIRCDGLPTVSLGKRGERKVSRSSLEQWIKQQESCSGI